MKKKSILNRAMFRQVKSPAYGTGISANLVSNEERQRYNYGGRVGLVRGTGDKDLWTWKEGNKIPKSYLGQWEGEYTGNLNYPNVGEPIYNPDIYESEGDLPSLYDLNKYDYYGPLGQDKPYVIGKTEPARGVGKEIIARGDPDSEKGDVWFRGEDQEVQEYPTDESLMVAKAEIEGKKNKLFSDTIVEEDLIPDNLGDRGKGFGDAMPPPPGEDDTTMLDIPGIVDKYYDKKASLGAAQLGLAGQVLKAGFQPKKDAMGTVGDAMGQFGKDIQKDKQVFEKLAATGEIQRELYRTSRSEEGKQDRATQKYKTELTEWLKKNGAEEDDISDVENYTGLIYGWDQGKRGDMTGHQHQDLIARFDEKFATDSIVISPTTTGIGKDKVTSLTEFDQTQLDKANEGDTIIIGKDIFVKDASAPGQMRKVNYTQIKLAKKQKKKPFKRFN